MIAAQAAALCPKTFTLPMFERAVARTYHGTDLPPKGSYGHLWRIVKCQRARRDYWRARAFWGSARDSWAARRQARYRTNQPWNGPVTASWFDDSGTTGCGIHATYGFATLLNIPCGSQITMRGPGGTVVATREDSGPYVAGRTFDLNPSLRAALGCSDLCSIFWRP